MPHFELVVDNKKKAINLQRGLYTSLDDNSGHFTKGDLVIVTEDDDKRLILTNLSRLTTCYAGNVCSAAYFEPQTEKCKVEFIVK
jgi:hypothetical protein